MKTTDLFNFRFVDRGREREILNAFFQNNTDNVLWIKGGSGFGKTTFFNYVYNNWKEFSLCYVNIESDSDSSKIINKFIMELQKQCNDNFLSVVKKKYKKFYNEAYKTSKEINDIISPQISNIVSMILDVSNIVVTLSDEHMNSIELINDYIRKILENKKLCICIDNFSRCDIETANIFFQIFKTFLGEEYFRACIITTSEELGTGLQEAIYHQLPYTEIKIEELDKYIYFFQILEPIFELKDFDNNDLEYLYKKCNGSPQKLSTIISKLLEKNGVFIGSYKAEINKKILVNILQEEHIRFGEDDFESEEKWFIFSYLCLGEVADVDLLEELSLFIAEKFRLYRIYNSEIFQKVLTCLVSRNIFSYNPDNTISPRYDTDHRELMDIFNASQQKGMFSLYAYEFLVAHDYFAERRELICRHAREADIGNWEKLNFQYGKELAKKKQYYDAQKIFSYLGNYLYKLHILQSLFVAINSYETGNYRLAIKQFETLSLTSHFSKVRYYYYYYLGKSYNNIGNVAEAVKLLERALYEVKKGSKEYVQILNMLHMYYLEIPGMREVAFQKFQEVRTKYRMIYPEIWANTMRGCHNFLDAQKALDVLQEAEKLLENELEKAFIMTTRGCILVRINRIECAIEHFEKASEVIKRLKVHEYSYASNNLATCYMLERNYQKAKDILLESLLWNRTEYGKLVIHNHLMICTIYLKEEQEAKDYYNYLKEYIEKCPPSDEIIKRKVFINLAIASRELGNPIMEKRYLEKASALVKDTASEWRYYSLSKKTEKAPIHRPTAKYQLIEDFEPWFLVYAHD